MSAGATDTGPFALIPEWVLYCDGLSDRAVRLYATLSRYADDTGVAWPSRRALGRHLGCSPDSIDRARAELEAIGALSQEPRFEDGRQTSNLYRIHRVPPAPVRQGVGTDAEGGVGTAAQDGVGKGAEGKNESHRNESHKNDTEASASVREPPADADAPRGARSRRSDPRADPLTREWWEAQDPRPVQSFVAARGVVSKALIAGWTEDELRAVLKRLDPPLSGGRLDYVRSRMREGRQDAPEWDRSLPSGRIEVP
jgi:hypothetical protein